jgi:uncharacterized membrane-anchored protein YhcB (DUF1043 family)
VLFRRDFRIIQKGLPDYSEGTSGLFRGDFWIIQKGFPDYSEGTLGLFRRDFRIIQTLVFDMIVLGFTLAKQMLE